MLSTGAVCFNKDVSLSPVAKRASDALSLAIDDGGRALLAAVVSRSLRDDCKRFPAELRGREIILHPIATSLQVAGGPLSKWLAPLVRVAGVACSVVVDDPKDHGIN